MEQVHGTCVDIGGTGILLRGPSGSGKSDLALRLIDGGALLVADDRVNIMSHRDGHLTLSAPAELAGKMEVRGIGIVTLEAVPESLLRLVFDLVAGDQVERLPEAATLDFLGTSVPLYRLDPFDASAPAKIHLAVKLVDGSLPPVP
ncbi:MAG: HPr kinase/phosphatase C-terminal domain-containing protein [Rhodospirillales bacterium]|nr:HPr kinase/phosphatase C-terminal domain-containing protein [Rhodospirillales bacterium]